MKAALFLLIATAAAQNQTGGLKGVVVDSVSRQPVKKATVTLMPVWNPAFNQSPNSQQNQGPRAAVTDAGGSFAFENLPIGQFQITVQQTNYPQAPPSSAVEIKPGEIAGPVTVELIPGAVISGHIVDEDGDPLNGCGVLPHPAAHLERGVPMRGRPSSNADGEYRISGIPSGKYIVSVNCYQPVFEPRPFSAGPDPPPARAYRAEFYPSATDAKSAEVMDLAPGVEKSGVDFQMKPVPVTQVRGTFAGDVWRGYENLLLQLMDVNETGPGRFSGGSSVDSSKGTFEFKKVFPGSYLLIGFSQGDPAGRIGVAQRLEVKDQPVETVLEWRRAMDISGTVEVENHTNQPVAMNQIRIQLAPDNATGLPFSQAPVQDDGSFTVKSVLPAQWRVHAQGPVFLKSAWMGTDEIAGQLLDLTAGTAAPLRIVVSDNTATIQGTGPANRQIVMEHVEGQAVSDRIAGIDNNGHYTFSGLAPGNYRLMVGDAFDDRTPDAAKEITVQEGETATVDFKN
ncbi:MAG TPA: carboxypeptidase-like regulatory domain-containing protein [Bryobacteraceae bacterium]|nr:carboxypeptidase-like regulatory domain-containing protein [Bryobacteraceae bacterium]